MLATWILVGGFLLGAACGGLATILIARIPDRGNLMARPKCPDCENRIAWRDLVPIISWLLLRGRCRVCGATIDWTFPVTEIASGGLFVLVILQSWPVFQTMAWLWFIPLSLALAFIDLRHLRLPNPLTMGAFVGCAALLLLDAGATGDRAALVSAALAALALMFVYLVLHFGSGGAVGMGDVKLALPIGLLTGYSGWLFTLTATLTTFVSGALVGAVLMVLGRADRKTALPWGPFMVFGALATIPGLPRLLFG